jgi:hypothetical protein
LLTLCEPYNYKKVESKARKKNRKKNKGGKKDKEKHEISLVRFSRISVL